MFFKTFYRSTILATSLKSDFANWYRCCRGLSVCRVHALYSNGRRYLVHTIRYDTIVEFNVDSKAEYTAKSSTRSQKLKQNSAPCLSL